jgi:hypothetical protein
VVLMSLPSRRFGLSLFWGYLGYFFSLPFERVGWLSAQSGGVGAYDLNTVYVGGVAAGVILVTEGGVWVAGTGLCLFIFWCG